LDLRQLLRRLAQHLLLRNPLEIAPLLSVLLNHQLVLPHRWHSEERRLLFRVDSAVALVNKHLSNKVEGSAWGLVVEVAAGQLAEEDALSELVDQNKVALVACAECESPLSCYVGSTWGLGLEVGFS